MAGRTNDGGGDGGAPPATWRGVFGCLVAVLIGLALVGGLSSCVASELGRMPGDAMERVWDTPYDRVAAEYGNRAWLVGDTVVRSRFDAVTAFDARSGKRRWEYAVPGRAEICATSTAAADSVALIGLMEDGKGCGTVAAIDLKDGHELWRTTRRHGDADPKYADDVLATGAGLAVLRDEDEEWNAAPDRHTRPVLPGDQALRAFDLRTGAPRWKAAVPKGCLPREVAVASGRVLAALQCATEAKLAAFDPADGAVRWAVPLGARRPVAPDSFMSFLSAEPTVLKVQEPGDHGVDAWIAFGPDGRRQGQIDARGGQVAVVDGKLFVASGGVVAYDLASGNEAWSSDRLYANQNVTALHVGGGRVTIFTRERKGLDGLYVYDSATGETVDERTFDRDTDDGNDKLTGLFRYEDRYIAVRWGNDFNRRPFSAYRTW
ncbi:PQQ-binding-like beta-propeller repeat protein [Streptomyces sp. SKN60]|uniref:outer membrane protein assembly factor BamB family protein n=1 Tax=Streptomyces sp. SKN60 TaxID=2855506 RepID=UPI0022469D93|nr:PQQ-binding-like beta-propeller repeat protein [Streptomyces sp. SKN60]MCX2181538.1 PQQ-binding-like beta-propeller repeat protein [Streptomyces sp. SKN60]